jgi:hypothetical protein
MKAQTNVIIKEEVTVVQELMEVVEAVEVVLNRVAAAVLTRKEVEVEGLEEISTAATKDQVAAANGETLVTIRVSLMEDVVGTQEVVDHVRAILQVATQHPNHLSQAVVLIPSTRVVRSTTTSPTPSTRSRVELIEFLKKCPVNV